MTEPRALHGIGAIGFLRFQCAADHIGKFADCAQMQLQRFAVLLKLLLQAVEQRLQAFQRCRLGQTGGLLDRLVEIVETEAFALIDFREIGIATFHQKARFGLNDVLKTLDGANHRL